LKALANLLIIFFLGSCVANLALYNLNDEPSENKKPILSFMIDYLQNCPDKHRGHSYISSSLIALNKACYYG